MKYPKFIKRAIDPANKCEACSVFDVNGDGILDIVCGEYWYEGPFFKTRHKICDIKIEGDYMCDFSNFPMDVNGDGRLDIITSSWWSEAIFWRENPGNNGEWKTHKIIDCSNNETIRYFDIDGCGTPEIFPNNPGEGQFFLKLIKDSNGKGTGKFEKFIISDRERAEHGMGFGDIDGDGKIEVILSNGILHQPSGGPMAGLWTFTEEFQMEGGPSVPILVHDVNKDGLADIIVGAGHNYGLFWYQQGKDENGKRTWTKHVIDGAWSQYHDMQLADIDGDGELELITGKRWRAHCGNDPGDNENVFICYYKINEGRFYRHMIEYGNPEEGCSGVGIYFWLEDVTGNGKLDLVAPGKEGLYLFINQ